MAEKTSDPYYDRLEALIDKFLKIGELMPFESLLTRCSEYPEKYGALLGAMYRARASSKPGGIHASNVGDMSDSQLQDAIIADLLEQGYVVTRPERVPEPEPEPERVVPIKRGRLG